MVTYAGFWRNDNMDYGQRGLPNKCPFFEFEGFSIFKRNIFGGTPSFQYFRSLQIPGFLHKPYLL